MSGAVPDWLMHRAAVMPAAEALVANGRRLTYGALDAAVDGLAGALAARGVRAGERVAVVAWNSLEFAEAVHAVPRLGAVLVLLNPRLSAAELAWQLQDARPSAVLTQGAAEAVTRAAAAQSGLPEPFRLPLAPQRLAAGARHDAHELAAVHSILYTSGTTGRPKGAMLTFGNHFASASASAFNLGVMPGDRWLACMPLFHVGGLAILLRSAIYGTAAVVHETFEPAAVAEALRAERITLLSVVPTMLRRLLDVSPGEAPRQLRAVLVGGGPVPLPLLEEALARGYPVVQTYGLTEAASQVATLVPSEAAAHPGSAGQPLLTTRVRVDGPPGEPGEILVAGPTVTPGYFGRPEATARALRDGWLHTGDIGRLDQRGFLYVLDRRDDLIVSGGENVYPAEVEGVLLTHPDVEAAAVVGVPDGTWGQVVAAAIVARPAFDPGTLDSWLRERLAGYKVPRRVVIVDALPLTANGKVQRHAVRARLMGD